MAPKEIQKLCVALCAIGLTGVITCCALPRWVVVRYYTYPDMEYHNGLWKMCVTHRTGPQECYMYDSMISSEFHALRALTIISCLLCGLSFFLLIFGSDFTSCVQNQDTKPKMILGARLGLMLAGLLVIIPVSWVAHNVTYNNSLSEQESKIGASIFIGWETGVLMILTGVLLCYVSRPRSSSSGGTAKYCSNRVSVTYDDVI